MLLALSAAAAHACGGFFCNGLDPVEQAGEVGVFEVSPDEDRVTMHVRVSWTGSADTFAWVVPVPANPELFVSTPALFDALEAGTRPEAVMTFERGACADPSADADTDADSDTDSDADTDVYEATGWSGVEIVSEETVGPYETAVLKADAAGVLVSWLQAHGYAVPDQLSPLLLPYISDTTHFLALKLAPGGTAGDLAPLGLTYEGSTPVIPIQLTAVAAAEDMPMHVYLLGPSRGVPLNYKHVQLNPLVLPWFSDSDDFATVSGRGADEAGGQAFTTAYAGPSSGVARVYRPSMFDLEGLEALTEPVAWFTSLASRGFDGTPELLEVLRVHLPAPDTVAEQQFYSCPACYPGEWEALQDGFDPVAATADLDAAIVAPRRAAQEILDRNAQVTRLVSTMSASEMTVDPRFGFNPDLPAVERVVHATLRYDCEPGGDLDHAPRCIELPGGFELWVPPAADTPDLAGWLDAQATFHALVIEQLSESGPGEVLADHTDLLVADLDEAERTWGPGAADHGCGCTTGPASLGWALPIFGLLAARRRW